MPPPGKRKKSVVSKRPTKPTSKKSTPTGRSGALTKQFKKSVKKARVKGIDTRSSEKKAKDFEKEKKERTQAGGDGRSQALQKAALQPIIDKNKFLAEQEKRREDILAGKIIPKKSDFTGFEGGVMGIRTGDFTDTGLPKIREGMTSDQYAKFMQDLYSKNPALMEKYFPVASGKALNQLMQFAPGVGTLGRIARSALGKAQDVGSGIMGTKIAQDLSAAPRGFLTDIKNLGRNIFGGLGNFIPRSRTGDSIQSERSSGGGGGGDRGGVIDAAQSVVDNIYGTRIGVTGPVTGDFRDSDGDGIDDRYQTGPGMKYQGPAIDPTQLKKPNPFDSSFQVVQPVVSQPSGPQTPFLGKPADFFSQSFQVAQPFEQFNRGTPFNYSVSPLSNQYTQQGLADPNLSQFYQNLQMFPRKV